MKNRLANFGIAVLTMLSWGAWAQVEQQNPNFEESLDYYMGISDSLIQNMGTTVQNTYKAYDWYEAREERKAQRRAYRHEERMNRSYYMDYDYPNYNYYPSYYNYRRWIPTIGFRTGNFWFSF